MKKLLVIFLTLGILLGLAACGGNEQTNDNIADDTGDNAAEIVIKASNFAFDKEEYTVKKGEPVKIVLDNVQGNHGIEIKNVGVKLEGGNKSTVITPQETGSFEIVCSVFCGAGHAEMKAYLVVVE